MGGFALLEKKTVKIVLSITNCVNCVKKKLHSLSMSLKAHLDSTIFNTHTDRTTS